MIPMFVTVGWTISLVILVFLGVVIILISHGIRGKVRIIGVALLSICLVATLLYRIPWNISAIATVFTAAIPPPFNGILSLVAAYLFTKPLTSFLQLLYTLIRYATAPSILLIGLSFLDRKQVVKSALIVGITIMLAAAWQVLFLPTIGKNQGSLTLGLGEKTETVGRKGGTVTIVSGTGTATLTIPKNALLTAAKITATPIDSIENLPKNTKLIQSYAFNSEDAIFQKPAKLAIPIPTGETKNIRGFAIDDKNNFISFPVAVEKNMALIPILHFSAYGIISVPDNYKEQTISNDIKTQAQEDILDFLRFIIPSTHIETGLKTRPSPVPSMPNISLTQGSHASTRSTCLLQMSRKSSNVSWAPRTSTVSS
jgi:hypothetical protein